MRKARPAAPTQEKIGQHAPKLSSLGNPIDISASSGYNPLVSYNKLVEQVVAAPDFDQVVVRTIRGKPEDIEHWAREFLEVASKTDKPVAVTWGAGFENAAGVVLQGRKLLRVHAANFRDDRALHLHPACVSAGDIFNHPRQAAPLPIGPTRHGERRWPSSFEITNDAAFFGGLAQFTDMTSIGSTDLVIDGGTLQLFGTANLTIDTIRMERGVFDISQMRGLFTNSSHIIVGHNAEANLDNGQPLTVAGGWYGVVLPGGRLKTLADPAGLWRL